VPLNRTAQDKPVEDAATKVWLFASREGEQMIAIKTGFTAAGTRAGLEEKSTLSHTLVQNGRLSNKSEEWFGAAQLPDVVCLSVMR
jgi:hypothetical protein